MKVELNCGEAIVVTFAETDGEVTVAYSDPDITTLVGCREEIARELQSLGGIAVHTDMPDTSGREGVVYHEPMGGPTEKELSNGFTAPTVSHELSGHLLSVAVANLEGLAGLLRSYARCENSEEIGDAARQMAVITRVSVGKALNVAPQMPHQDAVACLLFSTWADVGMRLGPPKYEHLTAGERQCISAEQLQDVARWVAQQTKVYCVRLQVEKGRQGLTWQWVHAGGVSVNEIDVNATAPMTHGVDGDREERIRRVISWPTRELAQSFLTKRLRNQGEVCELTVEQLWEACRA